MHFDIKPGEVQPGFVKEIKNEGMPIPDSNQRGNLYVKLNIDFSKSKTLSQDDLNVKRFIFIFKESSQLNFLKFLMH